MHRPAWPRTQLLRRAASTAVLAAVALGAPDAGAVPFGRRVSLRAEGVVGSILGSSQVAGGVAPSDLYSAGVLASARVGLMLFDPLSLQLAVTEGVFPSSRAVTSVNTNYTLGLRLEPRTVLPEGRIFVEAGAGLAITGNKQRFGFDLAIGWELALSRVIYVGPVVRYGHVVQPSDIVGEDPHDANWLAAGVSVMFRPFPPPRLRPASLLAINPDAPDRDYDGVPDEIDQCPDVSEDHDGFEDEDGCPDLDDDRDGIPDVDDQCPRAPETFNHYEDEDGCPDEVPVLEAPIVFRGDQLRLQQRIFFDVERIQVPARVMPILTQLADFLEAHPEVRKLRIEGHSDDRGTRRHGFELSLRRAENVVAYLVEHGVDPDRLEAVGYGDLRPLDAHHDEVTRAGNRRIEFIIADGPAGTAPAVPAGVWTPTTRPQGEPPPAPR